MAKEYSVAIDIRENSKEYSEIDEKPWMIERVPRKFRKVKESSYTPQLISIGPYHHGNHELLSMESTKQSYTAEFCNRVNKTQTELKTFVHTLSPRIRSCYGEAETVTIFNPSFDFDETVLRDSCFVIELLLRNFQRKNDRILMTPWLRKAVKLDMILLENQLPFFALKELYNFAKIRPFPNDNLPLLISANNVKLSQKSPQKHNNSPQADHIHPLVELSIFFFEEHFLTDQSDYCSAENILKEIKLDINHFTDLLRELWLPRKMMRDKKTTQGDIAQKKYLYCATKLDTAGVTFAPAAKSTSPTDIKISKKPFLKFIPGINFMLLKIPELKIETDTECLVRNVMALEQCSYPREDYICGYVALMDQLINTREDVDFLVGNKILTNLLGSSKEAAMLFNGLCRQIPRDKSYYARFYNELNAFYENRWNVTRATLKKVYFKDLWTGSSTVLGLFVLLFTITATTRKLVCF